MTKILEKTIEGKHLIYRGKPLVREGNLICYGDMSDKHVLLLIIISNKTVQNGDISYEVPENIFAQVLSTDNSKPEHEKLVKQFDAVGLYDALNAGLVWLDRVNK